MIASVQWHRAASLVALLFATACSNMTGVGEAPRTARAPDAAHASLPSLGHYNVDWTKVAVAGISSGADMATQLHYSYSAKIENEAVFAGGPYFCAQDNAYDALYLCAGTEYGSIPLGVLEQDTNNAAADDDIDPVADLHGERAWLFSGTDDSVVAQTVVKSNNTMLKYYGVTTTTNFTTAAEHGWVTPDVTAPCSKLNSQYLINCGFDAEQTFLTDFFGTLQPRNNGTLGGSLIKFDQSPYAAPSMDSSAYVFVPAACATGTKCKLVVALHGCEQGQQYVGTAFVTESGLNEWADTNAIIVLYPQAISSSEYPDNPLGCWDWWGYNESAYASQLGSQTSAIWAMMQRI